MLRRLLEPKEHRCFKDPRKRSEPHPDPIPDDEWSRHKKDNGGKGIAETLLGGDAEYDPGKPGPDEKVGHGEVEYSEDAKDDDQVTNTAHE